LNRPTTLDQAAAAHRHQASLYHPDKYKHLAPETKALASAKMAEINTAYTLVKLDIVG
jgi:DnaJ-class molecular chaperone